MPLDSFFMPGACTHEFFWPLRAADGHYYQVCRFCGAQCEYNWQEMHRVDGEPALAAATGTATSGSVDSRASADIQARSSVTLLVELEPAHRVFLDNLADVLRPKPPGTATFWSVPFWREVLTNSGMPWTRFGESMVCHMIGLAFILILSRTWNSQAQPRQRSIFENSHITYYKPDASFPALRGNPARVRPYRKSDSARRDSTRHDPARHAAPLRVAAEQIQASIKAPDIKLKPSNRPNIGATNLVAPMMPLASTAHSRLNVPAGMTSIVAPPPEVGQAMSHRLGLPHAAVVAPMPEAGIASSRRGLSAPSVSVIAPAPTMQASMRKTGELNIGPSAVVAPAPRLPMGEQRVASGMGQGNLGSSAAIAVPPPPSAPHAGTLADGRAGSLSGGAFQVVPPAPSVQSSSVQPLSGGAAGGYLNAMSSVGAQVVPPAPSLQGAGNSGTDRRAAALVGAGSGTGLQAVPPAPLVGAGGNSDSGGRQDGMNQAAMNQVAMNNAVLGPPSRVTDNPSKAAAEKPPEAATEEMPLRLIGLAMALPSSTYFSNYEVYIAERRLRKNLTELVKLVYVYLPYQRRLSEYGVDNSKVYKLLVSRDRSCDESLIQMTWPESDPHPDAKNAADAPALSADDKKSMLPCYRTTADDYRRAISHR
jgi:hypothetical protein